MEKIAIVKSEYRWDCIQTILIQPTNDIRNVKLLRLLFVTTQNTRFIKLISYTSFINSYRSIIVKSSYNNFNIWQDLKVFKSLFYLKRQIHFPKLYNTLTTVPRRLSVWLFQS